MAENTRLRSNEGHRTLEVNPIKYGDFLFAGTKTTNKKEQYSPNIVEFRNVMESDDHFVSLEDLCSRLETDSLNGLKEEQVISIRERYGDNTLKESESKTVFLQNRLRGTYYFLSIGIIFCFLTITIPELHSSIDFSFYNMYIMFIFILMIIISEYISCWQEQRSIGVMTSFLNLYPQYASVIRDGKKVRLLRREIVVGDLVLLKSGNIVPADIRLTKSFNLKVHQFPIIRNSDAILMKSPEITSKNATVSQNVVFCGTKCIEGYGQGIAFATGERTAYGQMMQKMVVLQNIKIATYVAIRRSLRLIGAVTIVVSIAVVAISILRGYPWTTVLILSLVQIIASMPDILYSTIIACLSRAAKGMVSNNCLPKHFEAVEKLGSTTVICCDKTGTITQNRMTIVRAWLDGKIINVKSSDDDNELTLLPFPNDETWEAFCRAASICSVIASKSRRNRCIIKKGCSCSQTEVAIMEFMNSTPGGGTTDDRTSYYRNKFKKVFEIPFNTINGYHVTIHDISILDNQDCAYLLCMKGAVEKLMQFCSTILINGKENSIETLDDLNFQRMFEKAMKFGDRVIGFCDYHMPREEYPQGYNFQESDVPHEGFRFLGFVSIQDPPRPSVPEAVQKCQAARIKVILMTGDHPVTGKVIARQVGIISSKSETKEEIAKRFNISPAAVTPGHAKAVVVTGKELDSMKKEDLEKLLADYEEIVFARITPIHKIKVVETLQRKGEVVAVTGGSLEDSEAMVNADIGIAMGMHGSDASRDAADIILLGDSFDSIVSGIEEGRIVYQNLRKAVVYVLSSNLAELFSLVVVVSLHIPFTLGAIFILLITIISETLPVLFISQQKAEHNIMHGRKLGAMNFLDRRLIHKSYLDIGMMGLLTGLFLYFVVMAECGFLPPKLLGIASEWNSPAINDLTDSFNQEWTYRSRKSLEYTCQTAFFLSIVILQCFNFIMIRIRRFGRRHFKLSKTFSITCLVIPADQIIVILILMYTPWISTELHFYPLRFTYWLLCLPFAILLVIYEEWRRTVLRHSTSDSWLAKENF